MITTTVIAQAFVALILGAAAGFGGVLFVERWTRP